MAKGVRIRPKPLPQRSCIACRQVKGRPDLVRIVRTPDGGVELDLTGKRSGRGAYLCRVQDCWQKGLKGGRLGHALRGVVSAESLNQLQEYASSLPRRD